MNNKERVTLGTYLNLENPKQNGVADKIIDRKVLKEFEVLNDTKNVKEFQLPKQGPNCKSLGLLNIKPEQPLMDSIRE